MEVRRGKRRGGSRARGNGGEVRNEGREVRQGEGEGGLGGSEVGNARDYAYYGEEEYDYADDAVYYTHGVHTEVTA